MRSSLARHTVEVNGVGTGALLGIWLGQVANSFFIDTLHWRHLWVWAALIWCSYTLMERRESADDVPLSRSSLVPAGEPAGAPRKPAGAPRLVVPRQAR